MEHRIMTADFANILECTALAPRAYRPGPTTWPGSAISGSSPYLDDNSDLFAGLLLICLPPCRGRPRTPPEATKHGNTTLILRQYTFP